MQDGADPIVGYTLAVEGQSEIFLHFSEGIVDTNGGDFTNNIDYPAGTPIISQNIVSSDGAGPKEIEVTANAPISKTEILNGADIVLTAIEDAAGNGLSLTTHRVSDLGLGWDNGGFMNPVWASDGTTRSPERGGLGIIRSFDGSKWLQDKNILLEAAIHSSLVPPAPQIWFAGNVPDTYISNELWLPSFTTDVSLADGFSGLVPIPNPNTNAIVGTPHPSGSPNLWQFTFPQSDTNIASGTSIGFFFKLTGGNPLYSARLEEPNASDWYRSVRPWEFRVQDIIKQRSGISILNNVINPLKGEKTTLHYVMDTAGMVTINVFNLAGDLIDVLYRGRKEAGEYSTTWDGRNRGGRPVARGVYFIRVVGPGFDEYRKVMVVK